MNTGIMLVRNDKDAGWSEEFWGDVARVSRINREVARGTDSAEGRIKVGSTGPSQRVFDCDGTC